jgi:DNA (cytosine-5)-methyltransferase 1
MTRGLVLSLFPGIGLLDMAFEEAGFCVVRGPDLIWGGDIRRFFPPAGRFDGVIGGPPCQAFSILQALVRHNGLPKAANLIPEFERCVSQSGPAWFVMENVRDAPLPDVPGYFRCDRLIKDHWCGGETMRLRRFTFGARDAPVAAAFEIEGLALHRMDPEPAALASGSGWDRKKKRPAGTKSRLVFENHKRLQGLPMDWDIPAFTVEAKVKVLGNGVPLAMGRAVAAAVIQAANSNKASKTA